MMAAATTSRTKMQSAKMMFFLRTMQDGCREKIEQRENC